jgi:hypothetical protein
MNDSVSDFLTKVTSLADLTSLPDIDIFCIQLIKDSETAMHPSGAAQLLKTLVHHCIANELYSFGQLAVFIKSDPDTISNLICNNLELFRLCKFAEDVKTIDMYLQIIKFNLKTSPSFKEYLC